MMDDPMNPRRTGDEELARRLHAYAQARLSPDAASVARMRARVMREARVTLDGAAGAPPSLAVVVDDAGQPTPIRRARLGKGMRRAAAVLLAAALSLTALGGIALGAQPGGPLYDARLWVEAATLPSDPSLRSAADLDRLRGRFADAVSAASEGNTGGVQAAVVAYEEVVEDALSAAGTDEDRLAKLEEVIGGHLTVLHALLDKVPEQARSGIENAIEKSDNALTHAGGQGSQGDSPGGNGAGGTNNGQGAGQGQDQGQGGGSNSGGTNPTQKPDRTPKAGGTPAPQGNPAPEHSPPEPPPHPTRGNH
jgi:hypothetical protein